jgi:energy-coupling factor transport system substrate-specific component
VTEDAASGRAAHPGGTDSVSSSPPRFVAFGAALAAFAAGAWAATSPGDAALSLLLVAAALVLAGAAWFESGTASTKEIVLVATLGAAAAAGRVLFAAIPGVQPVTVMTVASGAALGARSGAAVGATAALVSNFFLGQGPWTPWQMLAWGVCGVVGGLAAPLLRRRVTFAAVCCGLGFAFSAFMDIWEWWSFFPHTWAALTVQLGRGFWFDVAHAVGNVAIALAAGPELRRLLERYGRRLRTEVVWA